MFQRIRHMGARLLLGSRSPRDNHRPALSSSGYVFGGMPIPASMLREPHYLFMGMTDSGKTLLVNALMQSCLRNPDGDLKHRALVYDAKQEAYSVLAGCLPRSRLVVLNPVDQRCVPWDLASDVDSEATACQLADILCPVKAENGDNWFFDGAARGLLAATIDALRLTRPGVWNLSDVQHHLSSARRVSALLRQTDLGRKTLENYLDHKEQRTPQNVMASVWQRISPYRTIAALWARAKNRPISLTEWATSDEPRVLLLPRNKRHSATLDPIVRCIFERVSQLVTGRPDDQNADLTWIFLDEVARAPDLGDALLEILALGRSKGARCVLAMQDIDMLKSEKLYGDTAEAMLAQCGNVAISKLNSVSTREWGSQFVGERKYIKVSRTYIESVRGPTTVNENHSPEKERIMLPAEFGELPLPVKGVRGPTAVFATPEFGVWRGTVDAAFLDATLPIASTDPRDRGFIERPISDQEALVPGKRVPESRATDSGSTYSCVH